MFPFFRLGKELIIHRNAPELSIGKEHISRHMCMPWDLDMFLELNNGRTLSFFDLGRLVLAKRIGMFRVLKREGWGSSMAGACVRYRRRVTVFNVVEMRSRFIGWDARFAYMEQSMWHKNGDCANHAVYRVAMTDKNGIVSMDRVARAMGYDEISPPLPEWVRRWIAMEDARLWPPMMDEVPNAG